MDKKEKVVALLKSIETGDTAPIAFIHAGKIAEHWDVIEALLPQAE